MLHLIGKNLWARRYRNGWLLAELIIVSMAVSYTHLTLPTKA